jgi:hypothetical protein
VALHVGCAVLSCSRRPSDLCPCLTPPATPCQTQMHTLHVRLCPHPPISRSEDVDFAAFARDLQSFFTGLESLNSSLVVTAERGAGGGGIGRGLGGASVAASLEVDQAQVGGHPAPSVDPSKP